MSDSRNINAEINSYAIRCFRDTADMDYIAARALYRCQLSAQFLWSAQQCIEKYLKCILLLNRIKANKVRHNLAIALERINNKAPFHIKLDRKDKEIFNHLDNFGTNRYFEFSWSVHDMEILKLDRLVWYLRQYCQTSNYEIDSEGKIISMLEKQQKQIEDSRLYGTKKTNISGRLGNILNDKQHAAHAALVWANAFYSLRVRKSFSFRPYVRSENAPLYLTPDLIDEIGKYIFISHEAEIGYRKLASDRKLKQKS